jgi:6-phosphogluconate dehydrogenase
MQLGMVGLGKMGSGIARRLHNAGHTVVGFDTNAELAADLTAQGISTKGSLSGMVGSLTAPQVIWLMVPAGSAVDDCIGELSPLLGSGAILIDGGNSNYKDTMCRHSSVTAAGLAYLDVGTSGGVWGADKGYCLMVGGEAEVVDRVRPILETLAPAPDQGWGHVGGPGSGHYVKMIHNGIEYGMMQAYAEGFALLKGRSDFDLDLGEIADIWNSGSVVRSWLLELASNALRGNPELDDLTAEVADSGEGRWTVAEAIELNIAAPVITQALIARLQSRDTSAFSNRLLSALRREFGGHAADAPKE